MLTANQNTVEDRMRILRRIRIRITIYKSLRRGWICRTIVLFHLAHESFTPFNIILKWDCFGEIDFSRDKGEEPPALSSRFLLILQLH